MRARIRDEAGWLAVIHAWGQGVLPHGLLYMPFSYSILESVLSAGESNTHGLGSRIDQWRGRGEKRRRDTSQAA